jgi:hydrogenase-4 component F
VEVVLGNPPEAARKIPFRDSFLSGAPILALMGLVLMLGLYIPPPLKEMLQQAAAFLETGR